MKESDLLEYRERRFALDFLQRVKRLEKALLQYKYADLRDDDGERKFVQCAECLKKRPLLGGMDPAKLPQPFVCWMNWDELRASCSAPQGPLPARDADSANGSGAGNPHSQSQNHTGSGGGGDDTAKKSSNSKASHGTSSSSVSKNDAGSAGSSKKPTSTNSTNSSTTTSNNNAKRKPASHGPGPAERASGGSSSSAKKPKRR